MKYIYIPHVIPYYFMVYRIFKILEKYYAPRYINSYKIAQNDKLFFIKNDSIKKKKKSKVVSF